MVWKDAQCKNNWKKTYEKTIFWFLVSEMWSIFYPNFLEKWPQYHNKLLKIDEKLSVSPILLATRSKCISEDSMRMKKKGKEFIKKG